MRFRPSARRVLAALLASAGLADAAAAAPVLAPPAEPGAAVRPYVSVPAGRIALVHARLIDGRGGPALEDRTVLIDGALITAVQPSAAAAPAGYRVVDLSGRTILPGLVGMHDHMYYIARPDLDAEGRSLPPLIVPQMTFSSPRLYLASGVTTLRTTGSVEPYTDLNVKSEIDAGRLPGPHMDVTGPYLEGPDSPFLQMHRLKDAEDARRTVEFWADQGATSFKAYMNITRAELKAAVEAAHRRGLKVTGHLCAVTYPEAVEAGIDNLEHGFYVNTQLDPGKTPDRCTPGDGLPTLLAMTPETPEGKALIAELVRRKVSVTSTLPVFEQSVAGHAPLTARAMELMSPEARKDYLFNRNRAFEAPAEARARAATAFAHDMALERAFVAAGGLLLAGPDPTGNGGVLPGLGDQREVELLVETGFSPVEAVRIATYNGALYLGLQDRIGSVEPGKDADLVIVAGDPSRKISDIEAVETVFKDGTGYDSGRLFESVKGRYGEY